MATLSLNTEERQHLAKSLKETLDVVKAVDRAVDEDGPKGRRWTLREIGNVASEGLDLRFQFLFDFGADFMETESAFLVGQLIESGLMEEIWKDTYTYVLEMVKMGARAKSAYDFAKTWKQSE